MRLIIRAVFFASIAAVVHNGPVAGQGIDDCAPTCPSCQPCWSVTAGSVFLHRSGGRPETLVEDGTTDAELANVSDFDLGWAAGPQLELTRHLDCGWDLGVRYFSVDGWDAARQLDDAGNLRVPMVSDDPDDFFDTVSARYASRLYSTEVNVKRQCFDRFRVLAGFRWVELHEQISAMAYSPNLDGTFGLDAANHLYGFQMGVESTLYRCGSLELDGFLKSGIYGNHIGLDVSGILEGSGTRDRTSFLGELGLTTRYHLGPHCSVYGGYGVMWLEGVALAADGPAALGHNSSDMLINGTAFYHGALAGLEFAW
ncbi:MAG: hypothetical protein ACYC6Y_29925 [Thermoguttaceae bacterium]